MRCYVIGKPTRLQVAHTDTKMVTSSTRRLHDTNACSGSISSGLVGRWGEGRRQSRDNKIGFCVRCGHHVIKGFGGNENWKKKIKVRIRFHIRVCDLLHSIYFLPIEMKESKLLLLEACDCKHIQFAPNC